MTLALPKQLPLALRSKRKSDMRTQFGALVYRLKGGKHEVLLITSRGRKRWIMPKGWPMPGVTPSQAAAQEAWEEAGVRGKVYDACLGLYGYPKITDDGDTLPCVVMMYPVKASKLVDNYPEKGERRRKWFSPKKAAAKVDQPELAKIISTFDPKMLK